MKNPISVSKAIIFALLLIFTTRGSNAQYAPSVQSDFTLSIANDVQISDRCLEFDLFLLNKDVNSPFKLALAQAGILINPAIYNGGVVTASLVQDSSQLVDLQKPLNIIFLQPTNIIKLPARLIRTEAGKPNSERGSVISTRAPGTRICKIRLTNTVPFAKVSPDLTFSFDKIPYPTLVCAYIQNTNTPLTCNASNCFSKATNKPLK
ncbi:MAG: hypothetical protein ACOYMF_08230 [Bacteroidales bacterium]